MNAFDKTQIHRIQFEKDKIKHLVCLATSITNTNDLFVIWIKDKTYTIVMYDLDESNVSEHNGKKLILFKQYDVMKYTKEEIGAYGDGLDFKNFFCRGSSRKEKIDTNHKLLIFLHHGDNLFVASKANFDSGNFTN